MPLIHNYLFLVLWLSYLPMVGDVCKPKAH